MARVVLTKGLTQFTGGEGELELEATGIRFTELPMSPPKVLKAIDTARANGGGQ